MRRAISLVSCVVMALGLGCAGDDGRAKGPSAAVAAPKVDAGMEQAAGGEQPAMAMMPKPGDPVGAPVVEPAKKPDPKPRRRMIVYTGRVEMIVEDYDAARARMMALVKEHDGYEATSEQSGRPNETRRGLWTLRIPVANFQPFLDAVTKLGELQRQTLDSNDVTDRYFDTQAETTNLEAREKALRKLYEEKIAGTKLADLIEVDRELSNVRGQINLRKGQLQRWEQETAFATITVELQSRQGYVPPTSPDFGTTVERSFWGSIEAMQTFGKGVVVVGAAVAPWLALLFVIALPLGLLRWRQRRRTIAARSPGLGGPPA